MQSFIKEILIEHQQNELAAVQVDNVSAQRWCGAMALRDIYPWEKFRVSPSLKTV